MPSGKPGDGIDHMVSFQITGNQDYPENAIGNYVIAWEDLHAGNEWGAFDGDYGDLIVELAGVQPLPEPYSAVLFTLLGWFIFRHPRKKIIS
jgi:hypothetical protein